MSEFGDLAFLGTNAGAIVLVTGIVQILKINTEALEGSVKIRLLVWILSFIVLLAANSIMHGLTPEILVINLANSVLVALGCFGAYNVVLQKRENQDKE